MISRTILFLFLTAVLLADGPGVLKSVRSPADFDLTADPESPNWRRIDGVVAAAGPFGEPMPEARTEIRSRWSQQNLYFLFVSKYETMHLTPKPTPDKETWGIWDYDVVEVFIGSDFNNINLYKEFEVTPQGEFVDLDVDHARKGGLNWLWDAGMKYKVRVDRDRKLWFCEMQIPWKSIDPRTPMAGNELRLNLYRIEGAPPKRKYIAWQKVNNPSYHTPEAFGRLRLSDR